MRQLFLHIGQERTGSGFLQSVLARSTAVLEASGIEYPGAEEGAVVGNGMRLAKIPETGHRFEADKVLFSHVGLCGLLQEAAFRSRLRRICTQNEIGSVKILMFIRDPVAHAEAMYQQEIRRRGATFDPAEGFRRFRQPALARQLLENDLGLPGVEWTVLNYDRHRDGLRGEMARFLGLKPGTFTDPGRGVVNRAMTRGELALLRSLNSKVRGGAAALGEALADRLPEVTPDRHFPSVEVQEAMVERLRADIDAVNALVPADETYRINYVKRPRRWPVQELDAEQIAVTGEVLGRAIGETQRANLVLRTEVALLKARVMLDRNQPVQAQDELDRAQTMLDRMAKIVELDHQHRRFTSRLQRLSGRVRASGAEPEKRLH
ncbi:hypothetical protein [Psychromarinibacter sp. S121]|uniref:hypothetical protein n=1 Tax=Psychromarinibacter sp. S121 TaxID=3415127 RepID=UPI003C7E58F8